MNQELEKAIEEYLEKFVVVAALMNNPSMEADWKALMKSGLVQAQLFQKMGYERKEGLDDD